MSAEALFLIHTILTWAGLVVFGVAMRTFASSIVIGGSNRSLALRACLHVLVGSALISAATGLPHELGRAKPDGPWIPLVWPIMPFPGWLLTLAVVMVGLRLLSSFQSTTQSQQSVHLKWAAAWLGFACLNLLWWRAMAAPLELLRGAIPWSSAGIAAVYAAAGMVFLFVQWSSRRFHARSLGSNLGVYAALILGSAVFCLPLVWLLLTSFKERDDNTASNLVWVPKVTEQHSYFDAEEPLYSTPWRGTTVLVHRIQPPDPQAGQVEVERPFPLKGFRFRPEPSGLKPMPRKGIVVDATYQSESVRGFVRRDLVGGQREVEILAPSHLKGRVFTAESNTTTPVRKVGVRWQNYSEALEWLPPETNGGLVYLRNTLWIVVMSTIGTVLSCSLVAYGFSRVRFPGRSALFGLMLATMMLPGVVTMLPKFVIWRSLGAVNTLVPIWLPTFTASAFFVFLLREFFKTLPKELEDAAKIDGCNPLRTYWQVMLPQIKPALTVIGIWTFMGAWNDFMSPLIYVSSSDKMPISYAIQLFSVDKGGEFGLMMAFATMATVPVLLVFLIGQRFFVEGVQLSGLGGK